MAALVSDSWGAGRELDPYGGEMDLYGRAQLNRRPRGTPVARIPPRPADLWLGGQNNVATGVTGAGNPPPTNTNNARNARNKNNASHNNTLQQNSAASPTAQSQPQGRNRNRNRNRNFNRAAQQAAASESPNGQPGPGRGRGQNNRGQRSNQSNAEDSNLTTDPITGETISKRAAKRRRAKARKAAAGEAMAGQANRQQPRNQPQAPALRPSAPVNQTTASSATRTLNAGTASNARPAPSVPSVPLTSRTPIYPTPQPERPVTTATRPNITTGTTANNGATQSTPRLPVNEASGRTSLSEDTLHRWRQLLDQDTPSTVRPTNPVASSSNPPPARPVAPVRQALAAPSAPLASRSVLGSGPQLGRARPAVVPPVIPAIPPANNRPVRERSRFIWDSDDENDIPVRAQPTRNVREPTAPVRIPPVLNAARRPAGASARPTPIRTRPTTACLICLDIPNAFPQNRPTTRCTHSVTICAPCLEQHISHAVLSQGSTTIACPDPVCRQNMEYSDVIRGTKNAKACQDRYEALLLRRTLEAEPNFVWCKNASCNWGQVHETGANAPIVICQVCRARSCFTHDVPWHTGLTCAQYSAQHAHRERDNAASEAYITQYAKQCPNSSCGRRIEKSEGCDHMTCRLPAGCGHEFCWVCLADYRPILRDGNHHHNPTCRYYAPVQRVTALDDLLRQRMYAPIPRPDLPVRARIPPIIPVRPQPAFHPRPPPPAPAQEAPAAGSFLGWVFGAVAAAFVGAGR